MDLHLSAARPTDDERAAVDALLASAGVPEHEPIERGGRVAVGGITRASARRHLLLPALWALQSRAGHVSEGGLNHVCARLDVPPAEAYGVASFYHLLVTEPAGPAVVHVCDDIACRLDGALELIAEIVECLGPAAHGGHAPVRWQPSACLGLCDRAPAVLVQIAGETPVEMALAPARLAPHPPDPHDAVPDPLPGEFVTLDATGGPIILDEPHGATTVVHGTGPLLARVGEVDPTRLDDHLAHGGFQALARAVSLGPEGVLAELAASGLRGRGGAAFPTAAKWRAVADAPVGRPRYVVGNADESEPGTFKDRVLMEGDPYAVVEALVIAGFTVGAERGYLYVRGEYPRAYERLAAAVAACRAAGWLGPDIGGHGFAFDVEIRRGAGAYICGEETALFESIEGFRGEPRNKPPFPTAHGLFGCPTVVNNIETLVTVSVVLEHGGAAFAAVGTPRSTGTRLFCVSGRVARPGLYEAPLGTRLGELLERAGGVVGELRAIVLGGAAGSVVGPDALDLPLSFEDAHTAGVSLGSGVVLVLDDSVDLGDTARRIARFFREESCGQCVPCRVGTIRQAEALDRLLDGTPSPAGDDVALIGDLARAMRDASICGLGHTASTVIESLLTQGLLPIGPREEGP